MEYRNILWVDDCDDGDSGGDPDFLEKEQKGEAVVSLEIIKEYFPNNYESVHLLTDYEEALSEIENKNYQYDLVIFDIDFNKAIDAIKFYSICKKLKKKRVIVEDTYEEFIKKAGMYLYLFLLNCGYPNNRMIILTGNSVRYPCDFLKKVHIDPILAREDKRGYIYEKRKFKVGSESTDWVDIYYADEYYKVRRLVYKSCEYWKEKLSNIREKKDIAFNQLYYLNSNIEECMIETNVFIGMLDRVEMLFPVTEPNNIEQLFYQALQVVASFHEESAKITELKQNSIVKKYHQTIRNFRNWSAHNKFISNTICASIFGYMFCVALRTYFQKKENQFQIYLNGESVECYCIYEKEFLDQYRNTKLNVESVKEKYKNIFNNHLNKIQYHDKKRNSKKIVYR